MKDEYSLLNNVEVDFSQYVIEEVNEFEKKRMMKKFINSKNKKAFWSKKKVSAAVVALLLAVNLGLYGDKVLAAATSFKYNIATWLRIENRGEKYSTEIGKTLEGKDLPLNSKEDVKLVFATLAKECGVSDKDFTYSFVYDSTSYKNASKVIKVDKNIAIGENSLSLGDVIVAPDRVVISGSSKGFSAWENSRDANYYYDIVDENNNPLPLKEEIGKGAYFYRFDENINITTLKIVPYTFNKIKTNTTAACSDGRIKYIIEDKIVTVNLK